MDYLIDQLVVLNRWKFCFEILTQWWVTVCFVTVDGPIIYCIQNICGCKSETMWYMGLKISMGHDHHRYTVLHNVHTKFCQNLRVDPTIPWHLIGTLPLICSLNNPACWTKLWHADDTSAGGLLPDLLKWFSLFWSHGLEFGYFPEPKKCILVVNEHLKMDSETIFNDLGVKVVTGNRGDLSDQNSYVMSKVEKWVGHVKVLSDVAVTQPQLAYAGFTKSLQHKWAFLMCVIPGCGPLFLELEHVIQHDFLPTVFDMEQLLNTICFLFVCSSFAIQWLGCEQSCFIGSLFVWLFCSWYSNNCSFYCWCCNIWIGCSS